MAGSDGRLRIAFGLAKHPETRTPLLKPFAAARGLVTYGDYFGSWWPGSFDALESNLLGLMDDADEIQINLEGFSHERWKEFLKNPVMPSDLQSMPSPNVTNWEIYQVLKFHRSKAVFVNGVEPEL